MSAGAGTGDQIQHANPGLSSGGSSNQDIHPVIGITTYARRARWGVWDAPALLVPRTYADMVAAAGGIPVLLPPLPGVEHLAARLDALILSGGEDIAPATFGAQPHPASTGVHQERDAAEFALLRAALERELPVLGICRGLQVLNVAFGGTLHQHLPEVVGHNEHSPFSGAYGSHRVRVVPGSQLARVLGDGTFDVPTHHHQAIDRLGRGMVATAWADDGTIEAVEFDQSYDGFLLAVQWHPEAGDVPSLFQALIAAATSLAGVDSLPSR